MFYFLIKDVEENAAYFCTEITETVKIFSEDKFWYQRAFFCQYLLLFVVPWRKMAMSITLGGKRQVSASKAIYTSIHIPVSAFIPCGLLQNTR